MCKDINLQDLFSSVEVKGYTMEELKKKALPEGKPRELSPWTMEPLPEIFTMPIREPVKVKRK